jgi:hypothetical protein
MFDVRAESNGSSIKVPKFIDIPPGLGAAQSPATLRAHSAKARSRPKWTTFPYTALGLGARGLLCKDLINTLKIFILNRFFLEIYRFLT